MEINKARKIAEQVNELDTFKKIKYMTDGVGSFTLSITCNGENLSLNPKKARLLSKIINSYARKEIELLENHIKNNY